MHIAETDNTAPVRGHEKSKVERLKPGGLTPGFNLWL